jgi:GDP-4-dehydro-6-deoxy-D-mannose reductase
MNILITGTAGFAGSHLIEYLLTNQPGAVIYGADRFNCRMDNIRHLAGRFTFIEFDLNDYPSVMRVVAKCRPDIIFHLAAQSFVPTSWVAPAETVTTNIAGQVHLFEAVRSLSIDPVIQIACSSEEYGLVHPDECPITERNELRPLSPYAVSKVAQDMLGFQYFRSYGMRIIRTRAFNHTGPRRGEQFVTSSFAKQIAEAEAGRRPPVINVGNLEAERDFTDVRDMVRAYWMAVTAGEPGAVYNICAGNRIAIRDVLATLMRRSFILPDLEIRSDPERMRPSDVPLLFGDYTAFRVQTGWMPVVPFERTMADLLDHWRGVVRGIIESETTNGGAR